MFAAVELIKPDKAGLLQRIRWPGRAGRVRVEKKSVADTAYFVLKLPAGKKGPDLMKLRAAAGREYSRLVLPERLVLPKNSPVGRFDDGDFLRRLCLNGLLAALKSAGTKPAKLSVALYDLAGRCLETACELLRHFSCVFVVTIKKDRYLELDEYAMQHYGTRFTLLTPPCRPPDCPIVLTPFGTEGFRFSPDQTVFSAVEAPSVYWVHRQAVALPPPYLSALPEDISPGTFAAALAAQAGRSELYELLPDYYIHDGLRILPEDLAQRLMGLDSGHGDDYNSVMPKGDKKIEQAEDFPSQNLQFHF